MESLPEGAFEFKDRRRFRSFAVSLAQDVPGFDAGSFNKMFPIWVLVDTEATRDKVEELRGLFTRDPWNPMHKLFQSTLGDLRELIGSRNSTSYAPWVRYLDEFPTELLQRKFVQEFLYVSTTKRADYDTKIPKPPEPSQVGTFSQSDYRTNMSYRDLVGSYERNKSRIQKNIELFDSLTNRGIEPITPQELGDLLRDNIVNRILPHNPNLKP